MVRAVHRLEQVAFLRLLPHAEEVFASLGRTAAREVGQLHSHQLRRGSQLLLVVAREWNAVFHEGVESPNPVIDELPSLVTEDRRELAVAVVGEVSAGLVHFDAADVRRIHGLVPARQQLLLDEVFEDRANGRSLGKPQAQPLPHLLTDREQVELLPQHTMIPPLGLVDLIEISVQVLLRKPRGPVQPLKLLPRRIALPIGSRDGQEFERFDPFRIRHMRPAAEIDELTLPIEADGRMSRQPGVDVLNLQLLRHAIDELHGLIPATDEPLEWLSRIDDRLHFGLDAREVVFTDFVVAGDVVIEPLPGRRPERQLDTRPQPHDGPRHDVRTRVPHDPQRSRIFLREQLNRNGSLGGGLGQRTHQIDDGLPHLRPDRRRCESWADCHRDIKCRRLVGMLNNRTIGQANGQHGVATS